MELMRLEDNFYANDCKNNEELLNRIEEWGLQYSGEIMFLCDTIEKRIPLSAPFQYGSLGSLIHGFVNIICESGDYIKAGKAFPIKEPEFTEQEGWRFDWGFYAFELIDLLTDELFSKSYVNRN